MPLSKLLADLHFWVHSCLSLWLRYKLWLEKCELIGRLPTSAQKQKQYLNSPSIVLTVFILFFQRAESRSELPPWCWAPRHTAHVWPWAVLCAGSREEHTAPRDLSDPQPFLQPEQQKQKKKSFCSIITPTSYKSAPRRSGLDFKHSRDNTGEPESTARLRKFFSLFYQKH